MTTCRVIEEPCNGKLLSTVLKTSEFREGLAEFTDKQILIFSDAGGTGRSYHADLNAVNRRRRSRLVFTRWVWKHFEQNGLLLRARKLYILMLKLVASPIT
ncbi:MAG: strawberry notch C-terminal domain-containing protein [Nostoc sp.]|uniref:strawberry notch C-terminal domain-containing protein n=1 Tax=Nostoc sp. TaxID=1180 RepID=UPI00303840A5